MLMILGATASLKGSSGLSAFAMSKFGTRAMAQSLAREFGPKGVHVSHAIIDGIIDTEKTKSFGQNAPDAKIDPQGVSGSCFLSLLSLLCSCLVPSLTRPCRLRTLTGIYTHNPEVRLLTRLTLGPSPRSGER